MTKTVSKKALGGWGEKVAAVFLERAGYRIVAANYYSPYGEIDLICKDDSTWCFVEVKTRRSNAYGDGCAAVTPVKQRHLVRAALYFLTENATPDAKARFDVVAIDFVTREVYRVSHVKNAFSVAEEVFFC